MEQTTPELVIKPLCYYITQYKSIKAKGNTAGSLLRTHRRAPNGTLNSPGFYCLSNRGWFKMLLFARQSYQGPFKQLTAEPVIPDTAVLSCTSPFTSYVVPWSSTSA